MSKQWPMVRLGEVLRHRNEFIIIDDLKVYKRARVQLHAQGIALRDRVDGSLIKTKQQQVCRAGEFLVAEIDAKVGGFGIVPETLDEAIVSSHYFVFVINEARLDRGFLDYFVRTRAFRDQVRAQGSTNYAAIRPGDVLGYSLPLPPQPEQRRVAARIEELAAQIDAARTLRGKAMQQADALLNAISAAIFDQPLRDGTTPLGAICCLQRGRFSFRPRNDPRFFGGPHPFIQIGEIEGSDKYIRHWTQTLNDDGLAISRKFPRGTLLVSIAATIGSAGILDFDCCVPDSIVAVTPSESYDTEFMYHYLGYVRGHLEDIASQSAQKNINLRILSALPVPKLNLSTQRRIVAELDAVQAHVDTLKQLQDETEAELGALLPSILDRAFKGAL